MAGQSFVGWLSRSCSARAKRILRQIDRNIHTRSVCCTGKAHEIKVSRLLRIVTTCANYVRRLFDAFTRMLWHTIGLNRTVRVLHIMTTYVYVYIYVFINAV